MEFKLQSDSIKNIGSALLRARKNFKTLTKNKDTSMYSYADLNEILDVILEPLENEGILVEQFTHDIEDERFLVTRIEHPESGEFKQFKIEIVKHPDCGIFSMGNKGNPLQGAGAQETYMKKYALRSFFGLGSGDDDDGQSATPTRSDKEQVKQPIKPIQQINRFITEPQAKYFYKLIGDNKNLAISILEKYGIQKIEDLSINDFNDIIEILKRNKQ